MNAGRRELVTPVEQRLLATEDALRESWIAPEAIGQVSLRMSQLLPGRKAFVYYRDPDGAFGPASLVLDDRPTFSWAAFPVPRTDERAATLASYPLRGRYRLEGRFVDAATTFENDGERHRRYQTEILWANGLSHHLRTVLFRRGRMRAWYGWFGERSSRDFSAEERAIADRLLPALRDAVRAGDLTQYGRADPVALQAVLDAIDHPVWLLSARGSVVHANHAAQALGRDARAAAMRAASQRSGDARFAVSATSIARERISVVVARSFSTDISLPPSLVRVAQLIARGRSDKEIASELGLELSSVRTYVKRLYARLGVRSRVELTRAWTRAS
jgi:hypothetical protein